MTPNPAPAHTHCPAGSVSVALATRNEPAGLLGRAGAAQGVSAATCARIRSFWIFPIRFRSIESSTTTCSGHLNRASPDVMQCAPRSSIPSWAPGARADSPDPRPEDAEPLSLRPGSRNRTPQPLVIERHNLEPEFPAHCGVVEAAPTLRDQQQTSPQLLAYRAHFAMSQHRDDRVLHDPDPGAGHHQHRGLDGRRQAGPARDAPVLFPRRCPRRFHPCPGYCHSRPEFRTAFPRKPFIGHH